MEREKVAVLFTGGRDSSLVACLESLQDKEVHLITCNSGIGIKSELSEIRVKELVERFQIILWGERFYLHMDYLEVLQ